MDNATYTVFVVAVVVWENMFMLMLNVLEVVESGRRRVDG
jgi:hypothetical protein